MPKVWDQGSGRTSDLYGRRHCGSPSGTLPLREFRVRFSSSNCGRTQLGGRGPESTIPQTHLTMPDVDADWMAAVDNGVNIQHTPQAGRVRNSGQIWDVLQSLWNEASGCSSAMVQQTSWAI